MRTGCARLEWTFKSFVGVFGWMGVWLDSRVYYLLGLWLATPVAAWLITRIAGILSRAERSRRTPRTERGIASDAFLGASALLTLLTYVYYNITFLQHQGRYLFTALIPIAVFVALGWRSALEPRVSRVLAVILVVWGVALAAWGLVTAHGLPKWPLVITLVFAAGVVIAGLLPERFRRWAYVVPFALLPLLALYALFGGIVPALAVR